MPQSNELSLIFGYPGQDAQLLAQHLAARGERFAVVGRRGEYAAFIECDVRDVGRLRQVLNETRPHRIYYLAAKHSNSEQREGVERLAGLDDYTSVNSRPLEIIVNEIKRRGLRTKLFYASSSMVFKPSAESIDETSPRAADSLYAQSKVEGEQIAVEARRLGLFVSVGFLFNHESHLRPARFVSARIMQYLCALSTGEQAELRLKNPEALVDWGYAKDFVRGYDQILSLEEPGDYVMASGELSSVREFFIRSQQAFGVDCALPPSTEAEKQPAPGRLGNPSKLAALTGWRARPDFDDFIGLLARDWRQYLRV